MAASVLNKSWRGVIQINLLNVPEDRHDNYRGGKNHREDDLGQRASRYHLNFPPSDAVALLQQLRRNECDGDHGSAL